MTAPAGPILLAAFALVTLVVAWPYPVWADAQLGSGLMPMIGAGLVLVSSIVRLLVDASEDREPQNIRKVATYIVALVALPVGVAVLGMLPALAVFAVVVLLLVERIPLRTALLIAVGTLAFNWLVFQQLLQVALPRSALW
jgi:Tripartite tricarboxylate transporter TctB family